MIPTPKNQSSFVLALRNGLLAYAGFAALVASFCWVAEWRTISLYGQACLFAGGLGTAIGFLVFFRVSGEGSDQMRSPVFRDDKAFQRARAVARPMEKVVGPIILASIALAITGYFLIGVQ